MCVTVLYAEWFTGSLFILYTVKPKLTQIIPIQKQNTNKTIKQLWWITKNEIQNFMNKI